MAEPLYISLRYIGPSVDDGTMDIDDVIEALHGFSRAYEKVADKYSVEVQHQLKVAAMKEGSFDLSIVAATVLTASTYADQIAAVEKVTSAAKFVFGIVSDVFRLQKHGKGKPVEISVPGNNNTVVVINAENSTLSVSPQALDVFREKIINGDMKKVVDPLETGRIDEAQLSTTHELENISTTVNSSERPYFLSDTSLTSRQVEITGKFLSLNIERDRGSFRLKDDSTVSYRYVGKDKDQFHAEFSRGRLVSVSCLAEFNENLRPIKLHIESVRQLQPMLPLSAPADESK